MSNDILADVNDYLSNPTPVTRNPLMRIGVDIIPTGLSAIADRLQQLTIDTMVTYLTNQTEGDRLIQMSGIRWLSAFQEVIIQFGTQGSDRLVEILKHPVADMQALAALELSTDALKAQPKAHKALSQAMQRAHGTGLQLALAIALAAQDDFEALRHLAVPFLTSGEEFSYKINVYRQINPSVDMRQIEKAVLSGLVVPRGLGLVVWDIGTNGLGPKYSWSTWKRN
jgi:hypothetical protein